MKAFRRSASASPRSPSHPRRRAAWPTAACSFTTPGLAEFISGAILFDETIRISGPGGRCRRPWPARASFPESRWTGGRSPSRASPAKNSPRARRAARAPGGYRRLGARFTKWRAVIAIGEGRPTQACIEATPAPRALRGAEPGGRPRADRGAGGPDGRRPHPRPLRGGDGLSPSRPCSPPSLHRVDLGTILLKTGMVLSGKECPEQAGAVTWRGHAPLPAPLGARRRPGIVFLSGGQDDVAATQRLNAICASGACSLEAELLLRPRPPGLRDDDLAGRPATWRRPRRPCSTGPGATGSRCRDVLGEAENGRPRVTRDNRGRCPAADRHRRRPRRLRAQAHSGRKASRSRSSRSRTSETAERHRTTTIRTLSCPWPARLPPGRWSAAIAICGSGVGASVAANKVAGARACLIHETFSAHQGVEDDDLNMICLGGLVVGRRRGLGARPDISRGAIQRRGAPPPPPGQGRRARAGGIGGDAVNISPLAGKPARPGMLVDVPRLITAYYTDAPDPACPPSGSPSAPPGTAARRSTGPSTRGTSSRSPRRSALPRNSQGIDGPLFLGIDTHALSIPACATALEVLAANGSR